jgi:hypothetical protein
VKLVCESTQNARCGIPVEARNDSMLKPKKVIVVDSQTKAKGVQRVAEGDYLDLHSDDEDS